MKQFVRHEILESPQTRSRGIYQTDLITADFERLCAGQSMLSMPIWRIINLELWMRSFIDSPPSSEDGRKTRTASMG